MSVSLGGGVISLELICLIKSESLTYFLKHSRVSFTFIISLSCGLKLAIGPFGSLFSVLCLCGAGGGIFLWGICMISFGGWVAGTAGVRLGAL